MIAAVIIVVVVPNSIITMTCFTSRRLLCLCIGVFQLVFCTTTVHAFANTHHTCTLPRRKSTELSAARRREVFKGLRRAIFAGALFPSAFQKEAALAEEAPTNGRVVEFELAGLTTTRTGGAKSGKVKVQLRPEWAPRGVARFEVRLYSSN